MGEYEMISVIDYGAGNIQSVIKAFHHIGCEVQVTADREVIKASDAAILPGVGAFGDSMNCLKNAGLVQPVLDFIESGKPFLGICLGLQLLFEGSGAKGAAYRVEFFGASQPERPFCRAGRGSVCILCAFLLSPCGRSERCLVDDGVRRAD